MCSRYAFVPDSAAWADFRTALAEVAEALLALPSQPKIAPTDRAPIVVQQPGTPPQLIHARWGFIPHWWSKKDLPRTAFNARSEGAAQKPMWRDALRATRCLVPATSWYEWQHLHGAKVPHSLAPQPGPNGAVRGFMFAGLWSLWRKKGSGSISPPRSEPDPFASPIATCAIMTAAASPDVEKVHDRMPVVLAPAAWRAWLDPQMQDSARALALLREHAVRAVFAVAVR
ncbi:MAG: SOS response-associated peptidase [Gammaproteobacteria bacterium]